MAMIRKAAGTVAKADSDRTARLVVTTADVDRVGDVVLPEGVDLTHYKRNPVLLMGHDHTVLIGRCEDLKVEPGRRITAKAVLHDETLEARQAWSLLSKGYLNGVSIGFNPKRQPSPLTAGQKSGWLYEETELMEVSLTPVPANPYCTVLRGILDAGTLDGQPLLASVRKSLEASMSQIEKAAPPPGEGDGPPPPGDGQQPPAEQPQGSSPEALAAMIQQLVSTAVGVAMQQMLAKPAAPAAPPGQGEPDGDEAEGAEGEEDAAEEGDPFAEEEGEDEEEEQGDPLGRYRRAARPRRKARPARKLKAMDTSSASALLKEAAGHLEALGGMEEGTPWSKMHGTSCKYYHGKVAELCKALDEAAGGDDEPDDDRPEEKAGLPANWKAVIAEALAPAREMVYRVTGRAV